MDGSVSCKRETVAAGTSNASTMIKAPVADAFCRPVTAIVNVWLVLARPVAANIGTRISSVFEYVSTSDRKTPSRDIRAVPVKVARRPIQLADGPVRVHVACAAGVAETAAGPPL